MKPLTERMTKGGAAKAWIKEVEAKDRELERVEQTKDQYLNTIDLLAGEKEQLEAENEKLRNAGQESATMLRRFLGFGPSTKLELLLTEQEPE